MLKNAYFLVKNCKIRLPSVALCVATSAYYYNIVEFVLVLNTFYSAQKITINYSKCSVLFLHFCTYFLI